MSTTSGRAFDTFDETGNVPGCCNFAGLADFLRHNVVDEEAAIYLPLRSYYKHSAQLASPLGRNTGSRFAI